MLTAEGADQGTDAVEEMFDPDSALLAGLSNELGLDADETDVAGEPPVELDVDDTEAVSTDDEWEDVEDTTPYRVRVDGEDIEVTLDELLNGYQRQADYTRKTQALAEERERLAAFASLNDALSQDPQGTLLALAQHLGVDLGNPGAADSPQEQFLGDYQLDPSDPIEGELLRLRQELEATRSETRAQQEQREAAERAAAIDREIEAVRVEFGDTQLDDLALMAYARDNHIGSLRHAYIAMRAEEARKAEQGEVTRRLQRKRQAPPVEGGRNRNPAGFRQGSGEDRVSIEDALMAALSES